MIDEKVKAAINLHAVLRNMEDLCECDAVSQDLIKDQQLTIRFSVPGLKSLYLLFSRGKCKAISTDVGPYNMNLRFFNPSHLNQMMEGLKNPLPTKGFRHIGFLKNTFTALANRLSFYLQPTEETLSVQKLLDDSTILTAYTAFFALSEIANHDPIGKVIASHMENGVINIEVQDSVGVHLIIRDGTMTTKKGLHPSPKAVMWFSSLAVAGGILRGELDSFACIGRGELAISGRVPLIDNLNKLLGLVAVYLA